MVFLPEPAAGVLHISRRTARPPESRSQLLRVVDGMAARRSNSGDDGGTSRATGEQVDQLAGAYLPEHSTAGQLPHIATESSRAPLFSMPSGIHSQGPSHIPPYHQQSSETTKKPRTQFTPKQLYYLEEKFEKNRFPNAKEREAIAKELDLTLNHIQIWFQNRRAKHRRKEKKRSAEEQQSQALQPPSFWPSNLPFDSNIATKPKEVESGETERAEKQKRTSTVSKSTTRTLRGDSQCSERPSSSQSSRVPAMPSLISLRASSPSTLSSQPGSSHHLLSLESQKDTYSPLSQPSTTAHQGEVPIEQQGTIVDVPYSREMSVLDDPSLVMSSPIFAESPILLHDVLEEFPELLSPLQEAYPGVGLVPQAFSTMHHQLHSHHALRSFHSSYTGPHFAPPPSQQYYDPAFDISYLPSAVPPHTTLSQHSLGQAHFSSIQAHSYSRFSQQASSSSLPHSSSQFHSSQQPLQLPRTTSEQYPANTHRDLPTRSSLSSQPMITGIQAPKTSQALETTKSSGL